jgi:hypothetical protein
MRRALMTREQAEKYRDWFVAEAAARYGLPEPYAARIVDASDPAVTLRFHARPAPTDPKRFVVAIQPERNGGTFLVA